ncbi:invasion associated locus B family protein [Mangrovibrevibacter kandeliae]|uniref:invasion associated locus B family protein n=1 Tax=Mangrovibrevibacter kandeliae TaxID=2968473 RepID=UPI002118BD21
MGRLFISATRVVLLLCALAFAGTVLPALAQPSPAATGTVRSKHGAWAVVCDQPAGAAGDQCALLQTVVSAERPDIGLAVIALKTADGKARILRVLTPLGVILPAQIGVYLDGVQVGSLEFKRCFEDGCYAEAILDKVETINGQQMSLLDALTKAKKVVFTVFDTLEVGIGFDIDMNGFPEGFAALP